MKRKLPYFSMICFLAASFLPGGLLQAQNQEMAIFEQVVPNAYVSAAGPGSFLGPFSNSPRTYQLLIAASELSNLVGKNLTSISFRSLNSATTAWPTSDITFTNYDIYLSGSVPPANRSLTFAENVVGIQTPVRSGSLLVPANSLTFGATPNAFSFDINFTTAWAYTGGNLLIEIRHTGFSGTSRSVDAITTSTSGYATLFSACWQGNYTGTTGASQGNFCVVNIKGNDGLGNQQFDALHYSVYPNPTSDEVHIEGNTPMTKLKLFNMLGQMVLEETADSRSKTLQLSQLNRGTYLLQIESESGPSHQKVVRK